MSKLEVIIPREKTESVLRRLGELEIVEFINIKDKKWKYGSLVDFSEFSDRLRVCRVLLSRAERVEKSAGQAIPAPSQPLEISVDTPPEKVLEMVGRGIEELEQKYSELENMLAELQDERESAEKELHTLREEYSKLSSHLAEYKAPLGEMLEEANSLLSILPDLELFIRGVEDVLGLLATMAAGKVVQSPYGAPPTKRSELEELEKLLQNTKGLTVRLKQQLPGASRELAEIEAMVGDFETRVVTPSRETFGLFEKLRKDVGSLTKSGGELSRRLATLRVGIAKKIGEDLRDVLSILNKIETDISVFNPVEVREKLLDTVKRLRQGYEMCKTLSRYAEAKTLISIVESVRNSLREETVEETLDEVVKALEKVGEISRHIPRRGTDLENLENILKRIYQIIMVEAFQKKHENIKEKINMISVKEAPIIHSYKEVLDIENKIEETKLRTGSTRGVNVFEVWTKKENVERVVRELEKVRDVVVRVAGREKGDKTPTITTNPGWLRSYEKLTKGFGTPNYEEIDPTLIMSISFPIIFGFMFGDIGHGILILLGGIAVHILHKKGFKFKGYLRYLRDGKTLLVSCGAASIATGFLYGEFFGSPKLFTTVTGLKEPLWFSPIHNPLKLLKIAIILGIIQISLGITLDLVNKVRRRDFKGVLCPASWLWFYWSLAYLLLTYGLQIGLAMTQPKVIGPYLLLPMVSMFAAHLYAKGFMHGFAETAEKLIESLSNTVSYSRVLALGLAHAIFSSIAIMGKGAIFWPIFILTTLFMILALEGMLAFAHTLRLHWIEWFAKFYSGDGTEFSPLSLKRRFTRVVATPQKQAA
ncbi:MAG: hypothetical protein DRO11_02100 [Methanobacteriota archaeon]|nr:MAG: hypothetical protein DRO11_02100 [Euryarchaeota archaeon]